MFCDFLCLYPLIFQAFSVYALHFYSLLLGGSSYSSSVNTETQSAFKSVLRFSTVLSTTANCFCNPNHQLAVHSVHGSVTCLHMFDFHFWLSFSAGIWIICQLPDPIRSALRNVPHICGMEMYPSEFITLNQVGIHGIYYIFLVSGGQDSSIGTKPEVAFYGWRVSLLSGLSSRYGPLASLALEHRGKNNGS